MLVIGLGNDGCAALRAASEAGASVAAFVDQEEDSLSFLTGGQVGHINSQFLLDMGVPKVDTVEFLNDWQVARTTAPTPHLCATTRSTAARVSTGSPIASATRTKPA